MRLFRVNRTGRVHARSPQPRIEHHTGLRPRVPHQEAADTTVPDLSVTNPLFEVRLANQGASSSGRYAPWGQLAAARGAVAKLRYGA